MINNGGAASTGVTYWRVLKATCRRKWECFVSRSFLFLIISDRLESELVVESGVRPSDPAVWRRMDGKLLCRIAVGLTVNFVM